MDEELDAMLSQIEHKFDMTFQETERELDAGKEQTRSVNPENNSSPIVIEHELKNQPFSHGFGEIQLEPRTDQTGHLSNQQPLAEIIENNEKQEQKLSDGKVEDQKIHTTEKVVQKVSEIEVALNQNVHQPQKEVTIETIPQVAERKHTEQIKNDQKVDEMILKKEENFSNRKQEEIKYYQQVTIQVQAPIIDDVLTHSEVRIVQQQCLQLPIDYPESKQHSFDREDIKQEGDTGQLSDTSELMSYRSLTQKFQVALSRLKHSTSSTHHLTEFAARQQHYQRKKVTDLNLMRVQKEKNQARLCPAKPLINSRSQQLLINHKPIHQRYQAVIKDKQKKIEMEQAEKQARIAEEEEMMLNQMKEHQEQLKRKLGDQMRTQEQYYESMKHWAENRDKKVEDLVQRKKEEGKGSVTFKPQINPKSDQMMKKKPTRVPIYEKTPTVKKIAADSNCTFKPNLNKTLKK